MILHAHKLRNWWPFSLFRLSSILMMSWRLQIINLWKGIMHSGVELAYEFGLNWGDKLCDVDTRWLKRKDLMVFYLKSQIQDLWMAETPGSWMNETNLSLAGCWCLGKMSLWKKLKVCELARACKELGSITICDS